MSYRDTLNLPDTTFPMKANLPQREPDWIRFWEERGVYARLERERRGLAEDPQRSFVLHDGPPYSNGNIHLGTAANKIWKDVLNKIHLLQGKHVPYVPGWDNHGMPIENNVASEFKKRKEAPDRAALRLACREYAQRFIRIQMDEFKRLGVLGDWEHPYLTMDGAFEAAIVETFGALVEGGYIYRGLRSIHWCPTDRTALAEAEIEYQDDPGPSIHVAFPVWRGPWPSTPPPLADAARTEALAKRFPGLVLVIWTTTPWTLPANLFVMADPGLEYVVLEDGERLLLVAAARAAAVREATGRVLPERARLRGEELLGAAFENPWGRLSPVADGRPFVAADEGTGFVHSAPGHGKEDFQIGRKYGFEVLCPVDEGGLMMDEAAPFQGQHVSKVNDPIIAWLDERGLLLAKTTLVHSYPHCWRCRNPVIFRATDQWFMAIDANDHRHRSLRAIDATRWDPPSSKNRITAAVEGRPDWCVSRQRAWGVGIPALYCEACGQPTVHRDVIARVAERVRASNSDVWYTEPAESFVPKGFACPSCGSSGPFRKETDILDVWFDSGSTHRAVLLERGMRWPADVYIEGPDQHRGWFNSSLMVAVATDRDGRAPYRAVLTHGWVLDGEGRAMHKSLGNVIAPEQILSQNGADLLRLWCCSTDWRTDVRISPEILKRVVDAYRKVRNTVRFLIANLADAPAGTAVARAGATGAAKARLEPLDRVALARVRACFHEARADYEAARFHGAVSRLVDLCTTDLSAVYLDFRKDALYTLAADDPERRSAQSVLAETLRGLTVLFAPVLSFTAEEIWQHVPALKAEAGSVFETVWGEMPAADAAALADWERLAGLRDAAYRAIETERAAKRLTQTQEARVAIGATGAAERDLLARFGDALATYLLVSEVTADGPAPAAGESWGVAVSKTPYPKCERCWHYRRTVGQSSEHPTLCDRCVAALPRDFVRPA
ncbi:MAG: isoleucine--tRNA ligase [Candidatus Eiseniibacteriota bacterium]